MKNKQKIIIVLALALLLAVSVGALVACNRLDEYSKNWYYEWAVCEDTAVNRDLSFYVENELPKTIVNGAVETGQTALKANENYLLVCYGHVRSYSASFQSLMTRKLKFTLVCENGDVLYDDQAVEITNNQAESQVDFTAAENERFDVSGGIDKRYKKAYRDESGVFYENRFIDLKIGFYPKQNGTLYIAFALEFGDGYQNITDKQAQSAYTVGKLTGNFVEACINNVSVGYLSSQKYKLGTYGDNDLTEKPHFDDNNNAYMVVDFDFNPTKNNDGGHSMMAVVGMYGKLFQARIEEVTSGEVFEVNEGGRKFFYASFKIPPQKKEKKTARISMFDGLVS